MKNLLVIEEFPPSIGGIQTILYNICRNYPPSEMVVLTQKCKGWEKFDSFQNFTIYRRRFYLNRRWGRLLWLPLVLNIIYILVRKRIDIIHFANPLPSGKLGFLFKKLFHMPYLVYTFGLDISGHQRNEVSKVALTKVLRYADKIVTISEFTKNKIIELGIDGSGIIKVNMGVDIEKFHPAEADKEIVARYGLKDKKVILTVARLVERKGIDMVIRALPKVREGIPNLIYLIVGAGPDRVRLDNLVKELKLNEKVIFTGEISYDRTPVFYNACDIFIMPNRQIGYSGDVEGFGMVYIEANACGKPVIGGRSGGVEDAVIDGVTGVLVDPLDTEKIADALKCFLGNTEYAARLGNAGYQRVREKLRWEFTVEEIRRHSLEVERQNN